MSELIFHLIEVEKKPNRKGSKYDKIIDEFCCLDSHLVRIEVPGKNANYLRAQLMKRINARGLNKVISVSVVNGVAYFEEK